MEGCISRIETIKNMAVFKDFNWQASVVDKGGKVESFKKINLIYGRNYSGKTTLSRIIRSLESGYISDKYKNPIFNISFRDAQNASNVDLLSHGQTVRVFNEDFIRENLKFIVNDTEHINSFAILGEDNGKIEGEINELEAELGSDEDPGSLIGQAYKTSQEHEQVLIEFNKKQSDLETKLKDKANKAGTGIKHNKLFGDANYNVSKIKADISVVLGEDYVDPSQDQIESFHKLLREDVKASIEPLGKFDLKYASIASRAKSLLQQEVKASAPLQSLLSDAALELWVRSGRDLHRKKTACGFCGGNLPPDLWEKLDKHFNQESEALRSEIERLLVSIDRERARISGLFKVRNTEFYSKFHEELESLSEDFGRHASEYDCALAEIGTLLDIRKDDIYRPVFLSFHYSEQNLNSIYDRYESLRVSSNNFAMALEEEQRKAQTALRLHEVFTFVNDIKYSEECSDLEALNDAVSSAAKRKIQAKQNRMIVEEQIKALKLQLKDESKGADKVNEYLSNFFGHESLSLQPVEKTPDESSSYRFEVRRNNERAYLLSEGECSLIAFCYFIAKLSDYETKGSEPIIWIDDPICSLDSNHIFFIYSLINSEVVTPEQYSDGAELKKLHRFKQLFISTHNLDFFQYLKRLPGADKDKVCQYLLIHRQGECSQLRLMPGYLKDYVTEFNYLFAQIQLCASMQYVDDTNYSSFYNFANNARKFLEIYLYFKYPDQVKDWERFNRFFGEDNIPAILLNRLNNEYSHLAGMFERGAAPTEVPEMQKAAIAILERIKLKDPEQYAALVNSVAEAEIV